MAGATCIAKIVFHLVCTIHGADPGPQSFVRLEAFNAKNAIFYALNHPPQNVFAKAEALPRNIPVPVAKPIRPRLQRKSKATQPKRHDDGPVDELAFAASNTQELGSPFEKMVERARRRGPINPKLAYVKADGNEDMGCVERNRFLMGVLHAVKARYRATPIVDSGYRSPKHNRAVSGAKKSLHMRCLAVDLRVPGVSKDVLAAYLRKYPGMGGVGIYASNYVHFDAGPRRNWDWRGKRRRRT